MKQVFISILFFLQAFLSTAVSAQEASTHYFQDRHYNHVKPANFQSTTTWVRKIKYLGIDSDSIFLDRNLNFIGRINAGSKADYRRNSEIAVYRSKSPFLKIEISIDTSKTVAFEETRISAQGIFINEESLFWPVKITNVGDSASIIGMDNSIPLIVEGMDSKGEWHALEDPNKFKCSTGLLNTFLLAKEVAYVLIPKYSGNIKTELRLKLGDIYSATFDGYVNQKQFKKTY